MERHVINDFDSYVGFKEYLTEDSPRVLSVEGNCILTEHYEITVEPNYTKILSVAKQLLGNSSTYSSDLLYGKNKVENILNVEVKDNKIYLYKSSGVETLDMVYWILASKPYDKYFTRMKGNQQFKYIRTFNSKATYNDVRNKLSKSDIFTIYNEVEAAMVYYGITEFKGMKHEDIKVLSFDIETDGLIRHKGSTVYLITNTLARGKEIINRTHFRLDNYKNAGEMIDAWCAYVREVDPDVITGHNILSYDFDYLNHVIKLYRKELILGRDNSSAKFATKSRSYRVDGNQKWEYFNCEIFGRNVIDTLFTSVKHDLGRKYPSWGLKDIIKYEGLVKGERQFYDAGSIHKNWHIPEEREKIIQYGKDDSDDALALFYIQTASLFYLTQSIPKTFQQLVNSASGSWVNLVFLRDYLQNGYSIPRPSEIEGFEGAISYGIPGIYSNCFKQDVASLYPSIMITYEVCNTEKDYRKIMPEVVRSFTEERLKNKQKFKETKDPYYDALQQSQKVFINSMYGFLGTKGLHFNSPKDASFITRKGRDILDKAVIWATGNDIEFWKKVGNKEIDGLTCTGDYLLVNCDTDSIMVCKKDQSEFTEEEKVDFLNNLNAQYPDGISWEDDGEYSRVIVNKAKNYVLKEKDSGKIKFKGSSFKSSSKEVALGKLLQEICFDLIDDRDWFDTVEKYLYEIADIKDIRRWSTKKSVTESLLQADNTNKSRVLEALDTEQIRVGDKVHLYLNTEGMRQQVVNGEAKFLKSGKPKMVPNRIYKTVDKFDGEYDVVYYIDRLFDTISILKTVIDITRVPRYNLKANFNKFLTKYRGTNEKE
jgi:DNA polymerase elongation subunit (family B)